MIIGSISVFSEMNELKLTSGKVQLRLGLVFFLVIMFVALANNSAEAVLNSVIASWIVSVLLNSAYFDMRAVATSNFLFTICHCVKYSFADKQGTDAIPNATFVFGVIAFSVLGFVSPQSSTNVINAEIRNGVQAQAFQIGESSVVMLLDLVCDVVLTLDSSLQIVEDVPRFAALLMLGSTRSLKGMPLQNFIKDRPRRIASRVSCFLRV